jgi:hypothetical protein
MENLENQLIISYPARFRPDENCKRKEATTRTGGFCRDSAPSFGNYLKLRGTDGYQNRAF